MKQLHRKDLFGWSELNKERNLDFNSVLWVREGGNILIDPLPIIKSNYRVRKEPYFLEIAINRYGCSTVVEAMFNKKMTLIL